MLESLRHNDHVGLQVRYLELLLVGSLRKSGRRGQTNFKFPRCRLRLRFKHQPKVALPGRHNHFGADHMVRQIFGLKSDRRVEIRFPSYFAG